MIYPQTRVYILDGSNVHKVKCIQVENKKIKNSGVVGNSFIGVVQILKKNSSKSKNAVSKGSLVRCIVISTKKENLKIKTGFYFKNIHQNVGILLDKKNKKINPVSSQFSFNVSTNVYFKNPHAFRDFIKFKI